MAVFGQRVERPLTQPPSWAANELARVFEEHGPIPIVLQIVGGGQATGYLGGFVDIPEEHGAVTLLPSRDAREGEAHGSRDIIAYTLHQDGG